MPNYLYVGTCRRRNRREFDACDKRRSARIVRRWVSKIREGYMVFGLPFAKLVGHQSRPNAERRHRRSCHRTSTQFKLNSFKHIHGDLRQGGIVQTVESCSKSLQNTTVLASLSPSTPAVKIRCEARASNDPMNSAKSTKLSCQMCLIVLYKALRGFPWLVRLEFEVEFRLNKQLKQYS